MYKIRCLIHYLLSIYIFSYNKYIIIDQQIARHFVHYSESLHHPLPFYATQIIYPFLTLRLSANHDKGLEFWGILILVNVPLV